MVGNIHTYIYVYIHLYMYTCVHRYVHMRIDTCAGVLEATKLMIVMRSSSLRYD